MSAQTIIAIIAIAMVFVLASRGLRSGPRVTDITRTKRRKKEAEGDDA